MEQPPNWIGDYRLFVTWFLTMDVKVVCINFIIEALKKWLCSIDVGGRNRHTAGVPVPSFSTYAIPVSWKYNVCET